ncbi:MAG: CrcB family protein [Planctomycetales bacterium]|nr:CrcB family protein [Planctomycetales bacterium]
MRELLAVGVGGMLGSLLRYGLMGLFSLIGPSWLPFATLLANVVGCFGIGLVSMWALQLDSGSGWWITGLRVGLFGGLTTFSSFAWEISQFSRSGRHDLALGLGSAHLVLGLIAVFAGIGLANWWLRAPI